MGQSGKKLTLNSNQPKYGTKQLVSSEQAKEVRRRKITFSFSYFKQIPNFELGGCSQGWHVGLIERLGVLGNMTPKKSWKKIKAVLLYAAILLTGAQRTFQFKERSSTGFPMKYWIMKKSFQ